MAWRFERLPGTVAEGVRIRIPFQWVETVTAEVITLNPQGQLLSESFLAESREQLEQGLRDYQRQFNEAFLARTAREATTTAYVTESPTGPIPVVVDPVPTQAELDRREFFRLHQIALTKQRVADAMRLYSVGIFDTQQATADSQAATATAAAKAAFRPAYALDL